MIKLFFSYSHKDEDLRNELESHLALLKRQGIISAWHDRRIAAGSDLNHSISGEIESAHIILLLVSANFLASDYCYEKEMARALERHKEGSAIVIPVILHPCEWEEAKFGTLRATPTDGKPISMYANQQEAFAIVAKDIREVAKSISTHEQQDVEEVAQINSQVIIPISDRSSNLRIKRKFNDHEQDEFLENSYEYIARYFEGSLQELATRNPQIKYKFKRLSETQFAAYVYDSGEKVAECSVWYENRSLGGSGIAYSQSVDTHQNSYNEYLSVVNDGYTLQLNLMGISMLGSTIEGALTQEGAAEHMWSLFIRPLQ